MREQLSKQMYDVILYGLKLRERVAAGERPFLGAEQAKLRGMLGSSSQPAPWGSEGDPTRSVAASGMGSGSGDTGFLGMRYALTCWLDELFRPVWPEWNESALELTLFRTQLRAGKFWAQARLAEAIPNAPDALEAFLLCVLLGFRGDLAENPEELRTWVQNTRSRVTRFMGKEPAALPERAPVSDVPPLMGIEGYRRMTTRLMVGVLIAVPVVAFLAVVWFAKN